MDSVGLELAVLVLELVEPAVLGLGLEGLVKTVWGQAMLLLTEP